MFPRTSQRKRAQIAGLLARGLTVKVVSQVSGVAVRTISDFRKDPDFQALVEIELEEMRIEDRERFPIAKRSERLAILQDTADAILTQLGGRKVVAADAPLIREVREVLKAAATEMGDLVHKIDMGALARALADADDDDVRSLAGTETAD